MTYDKPLQHVISITITCLNLYYIKYTTGSHKNILFQLHFTDTKHLSKKQKLI